MTPGRILPPIELPSTYGRFSTARCRGKRPLVMLVGGAANGDGLESAAARLALRYQAFQRAGAYLVVVLPGDEATARESSARADLPFPVAWDEAGTVVDRLTCGGGCSDPAMTLYVTDRFMGIHLCVVAHSADELPSPDRLVALVEGIERECPECGVADDEWWAA